MKTTNLKHKTTMSDDFELGGEGEMEPTSSVTFSTSLCKVWDFVFIKAYIYIYIYIYFLK